MIEELQAAGSLLNVAVERYIAACSAILRSYDPGNPLNGISRAISDLIHSELELIASYETRIKQAKAIINQTKNLVPNMTPVNTLPPDILSYIFRLVLDMQPGYIEDEDESARDWKPFNLRYPETLSYVCSRWRHIAINSRVLWTRIDVVPSQDYRYISSGKLLARAEVFAARSDPTPLDLHIIAIGEATDPPRDIDIELNGYCASIATRIRSLNLSTYRIDNLHFSFLEACFANCTPGVLNRLTMSCSGPMSSFNFIEAFEGAVQSCQSLNMPQTRLEECLLPVTVLRVDGVYFRWTSQAYRGLTELRLLSPRLSTTITEIQLIGILAGSPRLRVFYFGLGINDLVPDNPSRVTARLNDLEVLNIRPMNIKQYDVLLRRLEPGSKPLQLSACLPSTGLTSLFSDEFRNFFGRSNVTKLYIQAASYSQVYRPLKLLEVLDSLYMPNLRTLSLAKFYLGPNSSKYDWSRDYKPPPTAGKAELEFRPTFTQLGALHLTYCWINIAHLSRVAEIVPIRALKLAGCSAEGPSRAEIKPEQMNMIPQVDSVPAPRSLRAWDPWS